MHPNSTCLHIRFQCFISLAVPTAPLAKNQLPEIPFPVEEFSDITELRCLAEMIGPYGVRYINEVISQKILAQYQELKASYWRGGGIIY